MRVEYFISNENLWYTESPFLPASFFNLSKCVEFFPIFFLSFANYVITTITNTCFYAQHVSDTSVLQVITLTVIGFFTP